MNPNSQLVTMFHKSLVFAVSVFAATILTAVWMPPAEAQAGPPMKLIQRFPLPKVEGYFDHMAVDIKGQRLFVTGEHQRTLEVSRSIFSPGRVIRTITGFGGDPRKALYLPRQTRFGWMMAMHPLRAYDGTSYELIKNIPLSGHELGRMRGEYRITAFMTRQPDFSNCGDRADGLKKEGVKDPSKLLTSRYGKYVGSIEVDGLNPAGFLRSTPRPQGMYVVMGDTSKVVVIDRQKREVIATWPITGGPEPHAVAIDVAHHRLLIGSRVKRSHIYKPGKMVVMDSDTGKVIECD